MITKLGGVPPERIITLASDDITTSKYNPANGTLYDVRSKTDMSASCKIDYSGKDVTKKRFQGIFEQNAHMGEKMLWSDQMSNVFAYVVGGGANSFISMPDGKHVFATDLMQSLYTLRQKYLYKNLILFVDTP